jgi:hypothetical protein
MAPTSSKSSAEKSKKAKVSKAFNPPASKPSFISNNQNSGKPTIHIYFDKETKLVFGEAVNNNFGKKTQYVGNLKSESDTIKETLFEQGIFFVGRKKAKFGDGALSEPNGTYINFQHVFVSQYCDSDGDLETFLNIQGLNLKMVSK